MIDIFDTRADAYQAGFIPARELRWEYRGVELRPVDVSGSCARGEVFAAVLFGRHPLDVLGPRNEWTIVETAWYDDFWGHYELNFERLKIGRRGQERLGYTRTVVLSKTRCAIGTMGAGATMWSPVDLAEIEERAKTIIDRLRLRVTDEMIDAHNAMQAELMAEWAEEQREQQREKNAHIMAEYPPELDTLPTMDRPRYESGQHMPLPTYGWRCAMDGKTATELRHRRNPEFVQGYMSGLQQLSMGKR